MKLHPCVLLCLLTGCLAEKPNFSPIPTTARKTAPPPMLAAAAPVQTKSIGLAWDPVEEVSGYRLYQGGTSGSYTNSTSTTNTIVIATNLLPKATYYFAAKSYLGTLESTNYSNEVSYKVPATRVKLVTQSTQNLSSAQWTNIVTNYDDTDALSFFYRLTISVEDQ